MRRIVLILLILLLTLSLGGATACGTEECYTPEPGEEVRAAALERFDEALDAMEATEAQREEVRRVANELISESLKQRKARAPQREELITAFMEPELDRDRVRASMREMFAPTVTFYHGVVDRAAALHGRFTPAQRAALAEHLSEPFEPLEGSWLVDQFISLTLDEVEASAQQRAMVDQVKRDWLFRLNAMRRMGHRDRGVVLDELVRDEPDLERVHRVVRAITSRWDRALDLALDDIARLFATRTPAQIELVNAKIERLRACEDDG